MALLDIQEPENTEQFEAAIRKLADVLREGGIRANRVWQEFCQGDNNLIWKYASHCASVNEQTWRRCQATVDAFMKIPIPIGYGDRARYMLRGQARSVQAAMARLLASPSHDKYFRKSTLWFKRAFPKLAKQDPGLGDAMTRWVVDRLCSPGDTGNKRASTWALLDGPSGRAIILEVELADGMTGRLVPDPIGIGPMTIGDDFVKAIILARNLFLPQDRCLGGPIPAGYQVVWRLRRQKTLHGMDGASVGAAVAAALRGAVEGVTLDACVAVSATLDCKGNLGDVAGADRKLQHAAEVGCDKILLAPNTIVDDSSPLVVRVVTFDDIWDHMSGMHRVISNYQAAVRTKWESEWSEIIGGDDENT